MMRRQRPLLFWRVLRWMGDLSLGLAATAFAFLLRIHLAIPFTLYRLPPEKIDYLPIALLLVATTQNLLLYFFGLYGPPRPRGRLELLRPLLAATVVQALLLMGYFFLTDQTFPRSVLLLVLPLNTLLLFTWRLSLRRFQRPLQRRVAIVGADRSAREVVANINQEHWLGLQVVGFVPTPEEESSDLGGAAKSGLGPQLGTVADLPRLLEDGVIDDIILAADRPCWQIELVDTLARMPSRPGSVLTLPSPYESLIGRMRYRSIHDTPLIEVMRESEWRVNRPMKRLLDVGLASLLLLLALPVIGICAVAILVTSPGGPILYRQIRVGQDRRPFILFKLRTMHPDAEEGTGEVLAVKDDPRLIRLGATLRRLRLDELPQLFNVIVGNMSLVGPRPERPGFVDCYLARIPGYIERFSIPPGVTGLAQINGNYHTSPETKLRYDLAYLANWTTWLDLSILLRTVRIVLTSQGT